MNRDTATSRPATSHPIALPVLFALAVLLLPGVASAETTVVLYEPGEPLPSAREGFTAATSTSRLAVAEAAVPGSVFIIPYYEVSTIDPTAEVALMSIRAEAAASPEIEFYPASASEPIYVTKVVELEAKEMWTANLRDQLAGQPGVPDGVVTGWVGIISLAPLTVDYFQVFPSDAFASGENAFLFEDLCANWRVRFLTGGGFSGGTRVMLFALDPAGGDSETDPPTFEGEVYDEAGNLLNGFAVYTDDNTHLYPASALVSAGNDFGSIDVRVLTENGGYAAATHDASGLYSVGLKGYCLDDVVSP